MIDYSEISDKLKKNMDKISVVLSPSSFDNLSLIKFNSKTEDFFSKLESNIHEMAVNKKCNSQEVKELISTSFTVKEMMLKTYRKKIAQTEARFEILNQINSVLTLMIKLSHDPEYYELFAKYQKIIDMNLVSEPLTSIIESKQTRSILDRIKHVNESLTFPIDNGSIDDIEKDIAFLINQYNQDISLLRTQIEELPFLLDDGDSSILYVLKEVEKFLPNEPTI